MKPLSRITLEALGWIYWLTKNGRTHEMNIRISHHPSLKKLNPPDSSYAKVNSQQVACHELVDVFHCNHPPLPPPAAAAGAGDCCGHLAHDWTRLFIHRGATTHGTEDAICRRAQNWRIGRVSPREDLLFSAIFMEQRFLV